MFMIPHTHAHPHTYAHAHPHTPAHTHTYNQWVGVGVVQAGEKKSSTWWSWLGNSIASYKDKLLSNLTVSIKNVHIRYEDDETCPGQLLACGVVLSSLDAFTIGADKNKTSAPVAELDQWRKVCIIKHNTYNHVHVHIHILIHRHIYTYTCTHTHTHIIIYT
jgi:hypothetical protein